MATCTASLISMFAADMFPHRFLHDIMTVRRITALIRVLVNSDTVKKKKLKIKNFHKLGHSQCSKCVLLKQLTLNPFGPSVQIQIAF